MMGKTHIAIAGSAAVLFFNTSIAQNPQTIVPIIGVTTLSALIADIDHKTSIITNKLKQASLYIIFLIAITVFIEYKTKAFEKIDYSTVINSFGPNPQLITGVITFIVLLIFAKNTPKRTFSHSIAGVLLFTLSFSLIRLEFLNYFILGFVSHIVADLFTDEGCALLYPFKMKIGIGVFKTNSLGEMLLRFALNFITIAGIYNSLMAI